MTTSEKTHSEKEKSPVVWIDLDNSPHVLFFYPIIRELRKKDIEVIITARDFAQVYSLATLFELDCIKVGKHYGKNMIFKIAGTAIRAMEMFSIIQKAKPSLAFSHGSRSQLLLSKILGIPSLLAMDFEGAKGFPLLNPSMVLLPEVLYKKLQKNKKNSNLFQYPGIKEDVYVPEFKPDNRIVRDFDLSDDEVIVTLRPPATLAHYHNPKSELLFEEILKKLLSFEKIKVFILPRTLEQGEEIKKRWSLGFEEGKLIIPEKVVNGLNLIYHSDLVISGGGTMIREAAALRIPSYSFFQGEIGAVDQFLVAEGRLILISNLKDVHSKIKIQKKVNHSMRQNGSSSALKHIVQRVEDILVEN
jgi:uncharacterized protein